MDVKEEARDEIDLFEEGQLPTLHQSYSLPFIQNAFTVQNDASIPDSPSTPVISNLIIDGDYNSLQIKSEPLDDDFSEQDVKSEVLDYIGVTSELCETPESSNIHYSLTQPNYPIVFGSIQIKQETTEDELECETNQYIDGAATALSDLVATWKPDSSIVASNLCSKQNRKTAKASERKGKIKQSKQTKAAEHKTKAKKTLPLKISESLYSNCKKKSDEALVRRKFKKQSKSNSKSDVDPEVKNGWDHLPPDATQSESVSQAKSKSGKKTTQASKNPRRNFSCGLCENTFSRLFELTTHMKEHTLSRNLEIYKKQSKWVCSKCGRMFSSAKNLEHHCSLELCERKKIQKVHMHKQKLLSVSDKKQRAMIKKNIARENLPFKYPCDQCGKHFKFQYQVRYHKNIYHSNTRSVKCELCDKSFVHPHTLKYHMRRHADYRPFKCLQCDKGFPSKTSLKQHMFMHSDTKDYKCDICGDEFRYGPSLFSHKKIHEGYKPYECTLCQKGFRTSNALKSHTAMVHMKLNVFSCTECGQSFNLKSALNEHVKMHSSSSTQLTSTEETNGSLLSVVEFKQEINNEGNNNDMTQPMLMTLSPASSERYREKIMGDTDKPKETTTTKSKTRRSLLNGSEGIKSFECPDCQKSFSHQGYLTKHMKLHTGESMFKCQLCEMDFPSQPKLTQHNRGTHQVNGAYPCKECDKSFSIMSQLNSHMMTHTGYRPYECEVCGKGFRNSTMVKNHMAKHTGERAFKCQYCDKTFKYRHQIKNHEKAHAKDRPFICDICGRGFSYQSYLKTHMREHTGERPYKCSECEKTFKQRPHLVTHMRTHTGEKPFTCQVCDKAFSQGHHLKAHHLQHHLASV